MYHRNGIDDRYFYAIRNSWEAAYTLAISMMKNNADMIATKIYDLFLYCKLYITL